MEPDHAANIANFLKAYPDTIVVSNKKAFAMMQNFFDLDLEGHQIIVDNGGTLSLGKHNLTFVFAPMVHWPEVMVTYDSTEKVLFPQTASENSVPWMQMNHGTMRQEDTISASLENMVCRFRIF